MNTFNILIFVAFVVFSQLLSCQADGDCDDVTVGECKVDPFDVITTTDIFTDVGDCQFYCSALTNCELFRFNGTECTLLTRDYRKDCQVVAGPYDKKIDKCFEIDTEGTCDLFLQEDCEYTGALILEPPVGTIADPQECEELCFQFNLIGCNYWVFDNTAKKCVLRGANTKICSIWAGPRSPTFDECKGTTAAPTIGTSTPAPTTAKPTTAKPTTAKPTTAKPTSAIPTTAKPTTAKPTTVKPTTSNPTTAKQTTTVKPNPTTT